MDKFCMYCGKKLINGQCSCQQSLAQQPVMQQPIMQMSPQLQSVLNRTFALFKKGLKTPISLMKEIETNSSLHNSSYVMGALQLFIILVTTLIHIPYLNDMVEFGDKFGIGLKSAGFVATIFFLQALATFVAGKKYNPEMNLKTVIAMFCVTTAPTTVGYLVFFIISFGSMEGCVAVLGVVFMLWMILSIEVAHLLIRANADVKFWMSVLINVAVCAIVLFVGKSIVQSYIESALGSLGGFGSMFF